MMTARLCDQTHRMTVMSIYSNVCSAQAGTPASRAISKFTKYRGSCHICRSRQRVRDVRRSIRRCVRLKCRQSTSLNHVQSSRCRSKNFALKICLFQQENNHDDSQTLWPNAQNDSHVQILQCMFSTGWYTSITSNWQIYKLQRFLPHLSIWRSVSRMWEQVPYTVVSACNARSLLFWIMLDHLDAGARFLLRWQCAFKTGKQWWWQPDFVTKRTEWQSCPYTPMYVQHRLVHQHHKQLANLQTTEVLATFVDHGSVSGMLQEVACNVASACSAGSACLQVALSCLLW